jgi:hypothetical protein
MTPEQRDTENAAIDAAQAAAVAEEQTVYSVTMRFIVDSEEALLGLDDAIADFALMKLNDVISVETLEEVR